jgi:putative hydrolase of the HAD superfamily
MSLRVVFDFGAVLFRWRPAVVLAHHLPQQATSLAALQAAVAALFQGYGGDWGQFDLGHIDETVLAERLSQRTAWPRAQLAALIAAVPTELRPQPAVLSLLLQLKSRGLPLSYLSNMPASYAEHLERSYPLAHWFESGLFSGRVHLSKPDPAIFALAAERFGTGPQDCLLIDDHPANIEAAKAGGWQAELFIDAPRLRAALQARGLLG